MTIIAFRMLRIGAIGLLNIILILVYPGVASAQPHDMSAPAPASPMAARCEALAATNFQKVPDAPTHLTSAKLVAALADSPAYCEVEGYVAPQVGILARLPAEKWNGRFLEVGCGGFCGTLAYIGACDEPLKKGYACITTDMGHRGKEAEGVEWAYNNPQAIIDFAYRATHVTALAGKAIVQSYYGRKPDKSYFQGCSCGGRQALVEAERFPWDFDGIIVGAPGINYTDLALTFAHRAKVLHDAEGKPLFDMSSLMVLGNAVIAKCDMNDGLRDDQIGDPRLCKFDPRDYVCKQGEGANCISAAQADAAVAFYAEQKSTSGDRVGERAYLPGAEFSYLGIVDTPLTQRTFYEDFFKYMALDPNPGPTWKFEDFDLNSDYKRLGMIQSLMGAENPDFSRFKQAGGKLIFYHGWADGGPSPLGSVALFKKIEATMGGRSSTEDFMRLFMVPDMDHCGGGKGPWVIDYLGYLEEWVEQGRAPDMMIGAHYTDNPMTTEQFDPARPHFTRPIFPYPLRAQYKGTGDPNSAANFKAVTGQY